MLSYSLIVTILCLLVWITLLNLRNKHLSQVAINLNHNHDRIVTSLKAIHRQKCESLLKDMKFVEKHNYATKMLNNFSNRSIDLAFLIELDNSDMFRLETVPSSSTYKISEGRLKDQKTIIRGEVDPFLLEFFGHDLHELILNNITRELIKEGFLRIDIHNPYSYSVGIAYYKP